MNGSQIADMIRAKLRGEAEIASSRYRHFVVDKMRAKAKEKRDKEREEKLARREELREEMREKRRYRALHTPKGRYQLSAAVREFMLEMQTHRCAICEKPFKGKIRPCVDHCHTSGKVRAFLCSNCNTGLGMYKDQPELLRRAAKYLETHRALHEKGRD